MSFHQAKNYFASARNLANDPAIKALADGLQALATELESTLRDIEDKAERARKAASR